MGISEPEILMGGQTQAWRKLMAAWWGLFLGTLSLAAQPSMPRVLFPPRAIVVLLAGVPGDVENENAYLGQIETWLQIIASVGPAKSVFVLCDNPESVTLPAGLEGKVLKADRAGFLGLVPALKRRDEPGAVGRAPSEAGQTGKADQLGSEPTNALVVIAWGHGGRQGNTPVFHVRGPRLTPADFRTLATEASVTESRWILMFRGSGAFARELGGSRRQILSSECDTAFSSDPVGLSVLLRLVRAGPTGSFETLCYQLGRATDAWYKERNLARTEEPTLWGAGGQPLLLAGPGLVSPGDDGAPAAGTSPANQEPAQASAPGPASAGLPPVWKGIQRVAPQDYPDADGVILRRRLSYTLGGDPAIASEQEEFIQILTPEGKRFGDFDISYSPPFEDISFLDCEVLQHDGNLTRLDPDDIREARDESVGDYESGRRKLFSLAGVAPGSVLHIRYQTRWKEFPMPHVSLEIPVGEPLPVVESTLDVSVPKEAPFHFALDQIAAPDPAVAQGNYGATYSWRFTNIPPQERDILAPPRQRPRLMISTFPDWRAFADWYGRISKLADEVTPEIAAKAKELTRQAESGQDKVLAVYNYVSGLRYVAVPLGVNSFRPHAAAKVLQNQFGDCKDKANLFNALLRALNIDARLVLVPRFGQAYDEIPGFAFNHAISQVTMDRKTLWVDTTDEVCRFGMLPPGDPGRKVLVLDGKTGSLTQLPPAQSGEHRLSLHGKLDCSSLGEALPVSLSAGATGYPDYELRAAAREAKEYLAAVPLLAAGFQPVSGSLALEKQTAAPISALDHDFSWQAEGQWVGLYSGDAARWLLHSPFWLPKEWNLALHHRAAALFLNQGYPLTLEEEFELTLPARTQPAGLPEVRQNEAGPLHWRIEWVRLSDDKVAARFYAELLRGELSASETPQFQKQLRTLLAALGTDAAFAASP
jgi:hypothetical protein